MSFSANEKFNGLFERFPRSPFGVLKQITHHFYWESKPRPQVSASVLMFLFFFFGGGDVPAPFNRNSESPLGRDEKNNGWIMLTLFENGVTEFLLDAHTANHTALRKAIVPSCKWVSLWWWGLFCVGTDVAVLL